MASVRFVDEESAHGLLEHDSAEETVLRVHEPDDSTTTAATDDDMRQRTLTQLRQLRHSDMTPHYYDPAWD